MTIFPRLADVQSCATKGGMEEMGWLTMGSFPTACVHNAWRPASWAGDIIVRVRLEE